MKRIDLDVERCVGCHACIVACLDQNFDVDDPAIAFRRTVKMENESSGVIKYISVGCMHCEDNPCVFACPTGAVYKDNEAGMVQVDSSKCVGCHSCLLACPFSAPKFDENNHMTKCTGCMERVKHGMEPACVKVCPSKAMQFVSDEEQLAKNNGKLKKVMLRELV